MRALYQRSTSSARARGASSSSSSSSCRRWRVRSPARLATAACSSSATSTATPPRPVRAQLSPTVLGARHFRAHRERTSEHLLELRFNVFVCCAHGLCTVPYNNVLFTMYLHYTHTTALLYCIVEFDMLRATGYRNLLQPGAFTNVHFPQKRAQEQSVDAASRGGHQYDQIWASRALAERHVALEGPARCALVVRGAHFLRHPLIPDASTWSFNGLLSDRCPVLLELCARSNEPPPVAAVAPLAMALHQQATTNSTSSMLAAAEEYRTQSSPPIANGHQHSSPPSMANGFLEEREAETISSSASHSPDSYESVGSHSSRFHTPDASTVINLIN